MAKNLPKPVLEVKNLVKKFNNFVAVDDISFTVNEGQILGFLGPNGAGKSTTIYCILSLLARDRGEIKVFGKDISSHRSEILQQMNYAAAEFILPWNLTVWENLLVYAKLYNVSDSKVRVRQLLSTFEISHLANKKIRELSAGERARAGFCKAFLNRPKLLLLDEPMASMDPDIVDRGIALIRQIQKEEKITILYTSHNMWEIEEIAGRVIFINHGKIVATGTPLELTKKVLQLEAKEPDLREVFIRISRQEVKEVS